MLMPKRTKYRKQMRNSSVLKRNATKGHTIEFGEFGLQALEGKWITNRQIESVRLTLARQFKKAGKVFIRIFPDKPFTKKPLEVRMGSGKGNVEGWVAVVKRNRVMFEVAGVPEEQAREALRKASHKLPIRTKIVKKEVRGNDENSKL